TIKLSTLPDGVYHLASRSVDEVGHLSGESHAFTLTVKTPAPRATQAQFLVGVPANLTRTTTDAPPPGGPLALTDK
ncbi:MAG: hypothetical protein LC745_02900, partial [Planctomycetia bacterium]|nr:hypothetical protein [Planctomycetia bacterium]